MDALLKKLIISSAMLPNISSDAHFEHASF